MARISGDYPRGEGVSERLARIFSDYPRGEGVSRRLARISDDFPREMVAGKGSERISVFFPRVCKQLPERQTQIHRTLRAILPPLKSRWHLEV